MAREMTNEERNALLEFQMIYGDKWRERMYEYHMGTQRDSRAKHISHFIRRIRNYVTPMPDRLPDLRKGTHHVLFNGTMG